MDSGPFRSPQPAERRVPSRSEQRQPEPVQQAVREEPRASHRQEIPSFAPEKKGKFKRVFFATILVLVILSLGFIGWTLFSKSQGSAPGIDTGKYQAVFFTNGQVYFGKLQSSGSDHLKLTDIFYLQAQSTTGEEDDTKLQAASTDQNNVQLIKLGNEVHGPEDQMIISRDQVLFYENLKADGKVAQSIEKYKAE